MRLIEAFCPTEAIAAVFSDESILQAMLDFEVVLARAEANLGVIPRAAAEAIGQAARPAAFDAGELAERAFRAGTLAIPFVKALTEQVRALDAEAAGFVHWGATSQDVADTAMVLLLVRSSLILSADHARMQNALRRLSDQHAASVMLGRTLLQPAPPVTFGLKAAGWLGAHARAWAHVEAAFEEVRVLQFGGASGTLAALAEQGIPVSRALAEELKLKNPPAPWHSHRDRLATLVCALGVYAGGLAKMARDIALLMQGEVGEAFEPGGEGRGGSSTMPHKRNPTASSLALAAAARVPGLVANFLFGMVQEHERAAGGWQAEWLTLADVTGACAVALASMMEVAEGLTVDVDRMRKNLSATRGTVFSERAMMLLGATLGRDRAHQLLEQAARIVDESGRELTDVLAGMPEVTRVLTF